LLVTIFREAITMDKYECTVCGYIYDEAEGDADNGISAGTKFADLAPDWMCPMCGADKGSFVKVD
jgi:hypothetical protein